MGLDIAFNRTAAIKAGLKLSMLRNGSDNSIKEAEEHNRDPEFTAWLKSESECVEIPNLITYVTNDGTDDTIIIRANTWGRVYEPITNWLKANNIEWSEF